MRKKLSPKLGIVLVLALVFSLAASLPAMAVDRSALPSFADLAEKVSPSVVNIRTLKIVKRSPMPGFQGRGGPMDRDFYEFFKRFFEGHGMPNKGTKQRSLGSGVIVDPKGYVVTNNHVVAGADEIVIKFKNGEEVEAKLVGRDPKTDIALLKTTKGDDYPALKLGDSEKLKVGEWVLALGNPFGLNDTVTVGIVSAKGRIIGAGPYDNFIQTDASINPGNSGGALVDMDGRLVGINTAIVAHGQGIGFAIPVNMVRTVMEQLRTNGKVVRGWLGVYIQPVTKELAQSLDLEENAGALVSKVVKDSPADDAGIKRGDVIVEFDGKKVKDSVSLPRMVAATKVGAKVEMVVMRKGREKELTVKLGELDDAGMETDREVAGGIEGLGMSVQELTPELAEKLRLRTDKGLVITSVSPDSPAAEAGLRRGDVILEADQEEVHKVSDLEDALDDLNKDKGLLLLVQRGKGTLFVVVKPGK
ncbi:DegQ family serine endoprotease [Dethiosulfatarculus sandiegensis]|uniref:Probable periplasmic serine endoprotease DegP-like n=1 Tax=Dethiosulfatarculus sandiegensis TaxID=1429043 RepID=A0A0D2G7M4_9BACT|nr:DegQ family serine endoprotease [Dethiosulfatarculus sandiegensis]KIX10942.1 peptidase [Dethiosulfatarculus sandiegensis]